MTFWVDNKKLNWITVADSYVIHRVKFWIDSQKQAKLSLTLVIKPGTGRWQLSGKTGTRENLIDNIHFLFLLECHSDYAMNPVFSIEDEGEIVLFK